MPIYEYRCQACGHALESLQKISDPPLTDCPECGRAELRKQVSAAGFVLKGGGWYVTDFKDKGGKSSGGSSEGKAEAKSDTAAAPACGAGACPACE
ncbi:MAG: zinc ribbon domain-containing protein [Chromatiales bacterium]|jgi:putative FmdB family regulatory protein|nr:zinc ribbon domain-containing protein [Chromatiales bacterium]